MRYKIAVRVLFILIILHSLRHYRFISSISCEEIFERNWERLLNSKIAIRLFEYSSNPFYLNYNEFLYYYLHKVLAMVYGLRQPLIVSWDDGKLFDHIVNTGGSCMVLAAHYMFPCTVTSIASRDRDLATVAASPEKTAEHLRKYAISDMRKIEIIKGDAKCLVRLAGAARKGKILICIPDSTAKGRTLAELHSEFFEFSFRMRIPTYFAKYRINADGQFRGYLKGPIQPKPEEAIADFIAFHAT